MTDELAIVFIAQGDFEAEQVCAFLEAHDIPATVQGEALRRTHGMVLDGLGETRILVPASLETAARKLLQQVEQGALRLPDEPLA